ncbi:MAG: hypothetical protein RL021_1410, partial [Bacteroidota bacterium]
SQLARDIKERNRLQVVDWKTRSGSFTIVNGHRSFTVSGNKHMPDDATALQKISDGLDALRVPGTKRFGSHGDAQADAVRSGFPVLHRGNRILLPDTIIQLKKISGR